MDIMYLVLFFIGIYCGRKLREWEAKRMVHVIMHTVEKTEEDSRIPIRIEKNNNIFYAWSTENSFMAQGTDQSSLENALQKRYPGKRFMATPENLKEVFNDKSL